MPQEGVGAEMKKLGGTMILHNAIKYDYCLEAALESLCSACDHVVVLDCESTDTTPDVLKAMKQRYPHLMIYPHSWAVVSDNKRLSFLTNCARDRLPVDCDWHFNLQADEVLHEDSIRSIRRSIKAAEDGMRDGLIVRRINFWGSFNKQFPDGYSAPPVSNFVCRIARRGRDSVGDAESMQSLRPLKCPDIHLFHYGFVRDPKIMLDKIISMQTWFGFGVDKKAIHQKETTGKFNPADWHDPAKLQDFMGSHPAAAAKWIAERRGFWK